MELTSESSKAVLNPGESISGRSSTSKNLFDFGNTDGHSLSLFQPDTFKQEPASPEPVSLDIVKNEFDMDLETVDESEVNFTEGINLNNLSDLGIKNFCSTSYTYYFPEGSQDNSTSKTEHLLTGSENSRASQGITYLNQSVINSSMNNHFIDKSIKYKFISGASRKCGIDPINYNGSSELNFQDGATNKHSIPNFVSSHSQETNILKRILSAPYPVKANQEKYVDSNINLEKKDLNTSIKSNYSNYCKAPSLPKARKKVNKSKKINTLVTCSKKLTKIVKKQKAKVKNLSKSKYNFQNKSLETLKAHPVEVSEKGNFSKEKNTASHKSNPIEQNSILFSGNNKNLFEVTSTGNMKNTIQCPATANILTGPTIKLIPNTLISQENGVLKNSYNVRLAPIYKIIIPSTLGKFNVSLNQNQVNLSSKEETKSCGKFNVNLYENQINLSHTEEKKSSEVFKKSNVESKSTCEDQPGRKLEAENNKVELKIPGNKNNLRDCLVKVEKMPFLDSLIPSKKSSIERTVKFCDLCEPKRIFLSKVALATHVNQKHVTSIFETVVSAMSSDIFTKSKNKFIGDEQDEVSIIKTETLSVDEPTESLSSPIENSEEFMEFDARKSETSKYHFCDICNKKFLTVNGLSSHKTVHTFKKELIHGSDFLDVKPLSVMRNPYPANIKFSNEGDSDCTIDEILTESQPQSSLNQQEPDITNICYNFVEKIKSSPLSKYKSQREME